MLNPCFGCDPHLAAAILCYLSFFFSGCSFFLYWYWLINYRDEQNPSGNRYTDTDSDCENLDVDNPHVPENEIENEEPFDNHEDEEQEQQSSSCCQEELLVVRINIPLDETSSSNSLTVGSNCKLNEDGISNISNPPCSNASANYDNQLPCASDTNEIINNLDIMGEHGEVLSNHDNEGEEDEDIEDNNPNIKSEVSNNPYLNGDTYSQNMLWGLHGIFTNLIEAILAALFYSGLFENNLLTSLIFVVGFGINFIIGNLLYILLLVYCTNKVKRKELRTRWALESTFNIVKDLYYLWVGAALLDHIITL